MVAGCASAELRLELVGDAHHLPCFGSDRVALGYDLGVYWCALSGRAPRYGAIDAGLMVYIAGLF